MTTDSALPLHSIWLDGGTDAPLIHLCAVDPVLSRLIDRLGPFGARYGAPYFRSLVFAIVAQQIAMRAALSIMARITAVCSPGDVTAARILTMGFDVLRTAGLPTAKAQCITDIAERAASGRLALDRFVDLDDERVISELVQVKGIGRWTAEMFLIFALARPDVLPASDLGLRTAIMREYGLPSLPDQAQVRSVAVPWAPYRAIAARYFWRSLANTGNGAEDTSWW